MNARDFQMRIILVEAGKALNSFNNLLKKPQQEGNFFNLRKVDKIWNKSIPF